MGFFLLFFAQDGRMSEHKVWHSRGYLWRKRLMWVKGGEGFKPPGFFLSRFRDSSNLPA